MADVLHALFDAFGGRGLKSISVMPCPILRRSAKRCRTITDQGYLLLTSPRAPRARDRARLAARLRAARWLARPRDSNQSRRNAAE